MLKYLILVFSILLFNCRSAETKSENLYVEDPKLKGKELDIRLTQNLNLIKFEPKDDELLLEIKNVQKNITWKITYKDWKIQTIAYKNWRVVENEKPIISKITEDGKYINFTFNYYKEIIENGQAYKTSILSGIISINKEYLRTAKDDAKTYYLWGLAGYGTIITVILIIVAI